MTGTKTLIVGDSVMKSLRLSKQEWRLKQTNEILGIHKIILAANTKVKIHHVTECLQNTSPINNHFAPQNE